MNGIDLKVKDVVDHVPAHEHGMIIAERAVKATAIGLIKQSDLGENVTPGEASRYITENHPEYRETIETTLAEATAQQYPAIYHKAEKWLTDNLIDAWKEEILEYYYGKNKE